MYDTARLIRLAACGWLFFSIQCKPPSKSMEWPAFDREGHRGCRGLMPENTIPAMKKAIDLGVNTLEMDAVISRDKQVVVSHETFFGWEISTTPEGKTYTAAEEKQYNMYLMDYAEIRRWDVGMKLHPRFPAQLKMPAIKPLLDELIDSVESYTKQKKTRPVLYNIETKSMPSTDNIFHPAPEEFTDLLMAVVKRKNISDRTIIQSFDPRTLQVIRHKYPGMHTSLLVEGFDKRGIEQQIASLGFAPDLYSPEFTLVNEDLVKYCHDHHIRLVPWTVNDKKNIERLRKMGVDGIISDYPNLFVE